MRRLGFRNPPDRSVVDPSRPGIVVRTTVPGVTRRSKLPVLVALTILLVSGMAVLGPCPHGTAEAGAEPQQSPSAIVWHPCPKNTSYQCATVRVPVDYRNPTGPTIGLAVARKPATGPGVHLGSLFINPGGPGESGVQILPVYASLFPPEIGDHFDLVSFDERGTGASSPLVCGPPPAAAASALPVPQHDHEVLPGAPVFASMARECGRRYGTYLQSVNTTNSARDMDRIRQAMGESTISYYGTSYGTVLGSEYARLFPQHVRAMVLDGAVDPALSLTQQATQDASAVEASLLHFFSQCRAEPDCPLGTDPAAFYEHLQAQLSRHPLPAPADSKGYPVTAGDLATATLLYLTAPDYTPGYETALVAAADGNGAPLRGVSLGLELDLDGKSLVSALWAITCNDALKHPNSLQAGALARALAAKYPLEGAVGVANYLEGCVSWPAAKEPITKVHVKDGPPLVVIGNTGDPNTPYVAAQQLTRALGSATLVTWVGWGHTWLLNGASDPCVSQAVTQYLVNLKRPPEGLRCH
jgi:pimeloyl-ACP methyl ester carboxylesterase